MEIRNVHLFLADIEYTNFSSISIHPGGLRKMGSAEIVLANVAYEPGTRADFENQLGEVLIQFEDADGNKKNMFRGFPVELEDAYPDIRLSCEDYASFLKWRIIKYDHTYRQKRLGDIFIALVDKYAPEIVPGEVDPLLPWVKFCKVKKGYKLYETLTELARDNNCAFHVDPDKVLHVFDLSKMGAAKFTIEEGEEIEVGNLRREYDGILSKAVMTCTLNKPKYRDEWTEEFSVDKWAYETDSYFKAGGVFKDRINSVYRTQAICAGNSLTKVRCAA